jgi:hypothetical protein
MDVEFAVDFLIQAVCGIRDARPATIRVPTLILAPSDTQTDQRTENFAVGSPNPAMLNEG